MRNHLVGPFVLNPEHELNQGRVAWWMVTPTNSGGGKLFDLVGRNHGTLTNMASATGWRGNRRLGGTGSLLFNGTTSSSYVDCGAASVFNITGAISVSAWMRPGSTSTNQQVVCLDGDSGGRSWNLDTGGVFRFYINGGAGGMLVTGGTAVIGTWSRLVGVFIPSVSLSIYINGVLATQTTTAVAASIPTSTNSVKIGRRIYASNDDFLNGYVDDISIWRRALSPVEILQDFVISKMGYPGVFIKGYPSEEIRVVTAPPSPSPAALLMAI